MFESVFIALNIKRQQTPGDFKMTRRLFSSFALSAVLALSAGTQAQAQAKAFTLTTQSEEAKKLLREMQLRVESFQGGPQSAELARKIVAADPNSLSGKAGKARGYGVPIITEAAFAKLLGVNG